MTKKRKGPTPKHTRIKLAVIPEPEPGTRGGLDYKGPGTVVIRGKSKARITYECGSCGAPLMQNIQSSQVQNIVLHCKGCGAWNETLAGT